MKNILNKLDIAKGYKTKFFSVLTSLAVIFNLFNIDLDAKLLTDIAFEAMNQLNVILTACGILYGLGMKLYRNIDIVINQFKKIFK